MESRAKAAGHPIHPMLIVFPLGLLSVSVVCDLIGLASDNPARWHEMAWWMIAFGVIGGLAAAVFGLLDWLKIPDGTRAKNIGLWHGLTNVSVTGLFVLSWGLRYENPGAPGTFPLLVSFVAVVLALVGGWLGGELVERLGVGVDDNANLNAPSSLRRPARARV